MNLPMMKRQLAELILQRWELRIDPTDIGREVDHHWIEWAAFTVDKKVLVCGTSSIMETVKNFESMGLSVSGDAAFICYEH